MPKNNINEQAVQETNDMSILSKASMSNSGYFYDPYLKLFASKVVQRAPLIHRGYFIRAKAIDYTLKSFLENHENYEKVQIVSLGAGFDSSYFRLKEQGLLDKCVFIEVDFPDVVKRKQNIINKQSSLLNLIGDYKIINGCLTSLNYKIIPCDLTKFQDLEAFFVELNIDTSAPTLFFSEVVLAYINYDKAVELLLWIKRKFENCITAVFEQIQPYDAFGQVMVKHFKKLNSPLQRVHKLSTVQDHIELLQSLNYDVVVGFDMNFFFDQYLNIGDKVDMFVLEAFDEFEEWSLMCSHYCLTVAFQGVCGDVVSAMFPYKVRLKVNITEVNNFEVFTKNLDQIPLMRYGHACSKIAPNQYLASGGFGVTQGFSHDKLSSGFILTFPDNTSKITSDSHVTVDTVDIEFKHMYHTLTYVSDGLLFMFGGRASPSRPCNTYGFYKLKDSVMTPENVYTNDGGDEQPCNRWRHAAAKFQNKIYIFGGRSNVEAALNDIWSFDLDSKKWKLENTSQVILPCFSPSMDVWDDSLLIYGGLAAHLVTFNSLYLLKVKEDVIDTKEMRFKVALPTRYSHSTHVIDDQLFVIGGIDPNCTSQPPILIISLKEKTWRAVALPQCNPSRPLMLHNHCSLMRSKGEIVVVGGGGNCFSFGTHLNQDLAVLDLFAFAEL